jgi:hypothetical protein
MDSNEILDDQNIEVALQESRPPTEIIELCFVGRPSSNEVSAISFYDLREFHLMTEPTQISIYARQISIYAREISTYARTEIG